MEKESSTNNQPKKKEITYIGEGCVYLETSGAFVEKVNYSANSSTRFYGRPNDYSLSDDYSMSQRRTRWHNEVEPWGIRNWLPQEILRVVSDHAFLPGLLNVKTILAIGQGIQMYERRQTDDGVINIPVLDDEIEDWLEQINIKKFLWESAPDVSHWAGNFSQIITNRRGNEVRNLVRIDVTNCRIDQAMEHCFAYETWEDILIHKNYEKLPLHQYKNRRQRNFVVQAKNTYPGSSYYPVNPAWGAKNWIQIANQIAIFKLASIRNGFSIKYHVKIPVDYFEITYPEGMTFEKDGKLVENIHTYRQKKELELYANLNKYLSGAKNANKLVTSRTWIDPATGEKVTGLEIDAIEDKFKYDAFLDDLTASDTRIISSQNFFPSIAGIKTINKLGGGGSETRNDYNIASQVLTTQPQDMILEPIGIAKNITFPEKKKIHIGFKALELATTDLVKSGFVTDKLNN